MNRNRNLLLLYVIGVSLSLLLETIIVIMNRRQIGKKKIERPKYYILSDIQDGGSKNIFFKHIHSVLKRVGYEYVPNNNTEWDLLLAQNYLFGNVKKTNMKLKPHQQVNQFPGSECITNKFKLATSKSRYMPKAFKLPNNIHDFIKYTKYNPNLMFLEKKKNSSGSTLKNLNDIDVYSGKSYVQEFIQKPFLVDGHKFDIGVYVVITSVNPLRAYWYKGDVLLRFCPTKYYPFVYNNTGSYIISSKYMGIWKLPSLSHDYTTLGHSMKDTLDNYLQSQGKDPSLVWEVIEKAIAEILVMKERHLVAAAEHYPSQNNFFEMMRFDFILDEFLKVYLLKVKKTPEFDSAKSAEELLLYEQLLYNLFLLTGVSRKPVVTDKSRDNTEDRDMITSQKHISVFGKVCRSSTCKENCHTKEVCGLCKFCLSKNFKEHLLRAHTEFLYRGDFKRLVPPPIFKIEDINLIAHLTPKENLSATNRLQYIWYQGKCNQDITWCA